MADTYPQTVEEAARIVDAAACPEPECGVPWCVEKRAIASRLRSGLADHERAVKEECAGTAANVLAVYRRHFSDPRLAEECRSEIVRALRTPPPSPEPVPAATDPLQPDGLPASFPRECCTCATEYCNDRGRCVTCRDWTPHDFDVARFKTPPAAAEAGTEPFCACGRRVSECDGSRAGCQPTPWLEAEP